MKDANVSWLEDLLPKAKGFENSRVVMFNQHIRRDPHVAHMGLLYHASELLEKIESLHKVRGIIRKQKIGD